MSIRYKYLKLQLVMIVFLCISPCFIFALSPVSSFSNQNNNSSAEFNVSTLEFLKNCLSFFKINKEIKNLKDQLERAEVMFDMGHGSPDEIQRVMNSIKQIENEHIELQQKLGMIYLEPLKLNSGSPDSENIVVRYKDFSENEMHHETVVDYLEKEILNKRKNDSNKVVRIRIDGEPGVGKSRLAQKIQKSLSARQQFLAETAYLETDATRGTLPDKYRELDPEKYAAIIVEGAYSSFRDFDYDYEILARVDEITSLKRVAIRNRADKTVRLMEKQRGDFKSIGDNMIANNDNLIIVNTFSSRDLLLNYLFNDLPNVLKNNSFIDKLHLVFENIDNIENIEEEIKSALKENNYIETAIAAKISESLLLLNQALSFVKEKIRNQKLSLVMEKAEMVTNILLKQSVNKNNKIAVLKKIGLSERDINTLLDSSLFIDNSMIAIFDQEQSKNLKYLGEDLLKEIVTYFETEEAEIISPFIRELFLTNQTEYFEVFLQNSLTELALTLTKIEKDQTLFDQTLSFLQNISENTQFTKAA